MSKLMQPNSIQRLCSISVVLLAFVMPIGFVIPVLGFFQCTVTTSLIIGVNALLEGNLLKALLFLVGSSIWYFVYFFFLKLFVTGTWYKHHPRKITLALLTLIVLLFSLPIHGVGKTYFYNHIVRSILLE